jgi:hypothetical protein
VEAGAEKVTITLDVPAGVGQLRSTLTDAAGKSHGAYFVTVERLD